MYKLSVPISINILTEQTMPQVLKMLRQCKAERVFLAILESVYSSEASLYTDPDHIARAIRYFQENGLEVGIWMNAFGHGSALVYQQDESDKVSFTPIEGVYGDRYSEGYCPLDPTFAQHYQRAVQTVARMHPDLIMLDDDFRLNTRLYYMGCFCPWHMEAYKARIGEDVPREQLEALIFTGGPNKYRSAYMALAAETLLDFAKNLRSVVDQEDPNVRLGFCVCNENWDYNGTDSIAITKALAGSTVPFLRINGAPYWGGSLIQVIEDSRLQFSWCQNNNVEVFSEGDTYPRPRYKVSSKVLELFDLALLCDGTGDGVLKYMFDYSMAMDYETGYVERHIRNQALREQAQGAFAGKKPVGVYSYNVLHKVENWVLPDKCPEKVANRLMESCRSISRHVLSRNSIPTAYTPGDYPVFLCGENARYIDLKALGNGVIADIPAARILQERGVDVGLISAQPDSFFGEHFLREQDDVWNVENHALQRIRCSERATVLSQFMGEEAPASYTYENADGLRFLVLACDLYFADDNVCFTGSYYRQAQLVVAIEWMCGRKLPAFCPKNPELYILTAAGEGSLAAALINIFPDEILAPVVQLDKAYSQIRFINCSGRLEGDRVYLSDIGPYGFAAIEVTQ